MPSPYRAVFTAPGTRAFSAAGFLGRMPLSMMGIGVVTMVSQITGRYGLAGALSATLAMAAAVMGPQVSRLVDRYGQRRVLRPVTLVAAAAVAGLLVCAQQGLPEWTLFVFAVGAGCVPSMGSMVRARWAEIYRGTGRQLHTAYAWESIVDEVCFIVGPIVSIGLSTAWFPEAGPLLAAVFLVIGVFWLTSQRATEPRRLPEEHHTAGSALRSRGLRVLVVTFVATGAIFGAVDVVTVAFAEERGHKAAASLVLAVYALGSCLAGAVFGVLHLKGKPSSRWLLGVCAMAVSMIPLQLAGSLPFLAVALFVAGPRHRTDDGHHHGPRRTARTAYPADRGHDLDQHRAGGRGGARLLRRGLGGGRLGGPGGVRGARGGGGARGRGGVPGVPPARGAGADGRARGR
ncbi:hypothetical protein GCM10020227_24880 [Streptomyces flavovirens]